MGVIRVRFWGALAMALTGGVWVAVRKSCVSRANRRPGAAMYRLPPNAAEGVVLPDARTL
jgi:hypothetical protein